MEPSSFGPAYPSALRAVPQQSATRAAAEAMRKRLTDCVRDNDEMTSLNLTYITPCPKETVLERMPGKALVNRLGRATHYQHFKESHREPVSVSELMTLLAFVATLNAYVPFGGDLRGRVIDIRVDDIAGYIPANGIDASAECVSAYATNTSS